MKILIIDHYDSFTNNLLSLFSREHQVVVCKSDPFLGSDGLNGGFFDHFDAVILSPGPGHPSQIKENTATLQALGQIPHLPILGVCLGHQILAQKFGIQTSFAKEPVHGRTSPISHDGNGLFLGLAQEFQATRYHSLTLSSSFSHHQHEEEEEEELRITAWTQDKIIMGVQHVRFPFYGVQFHPESILSENGREIIENFLRISNTWNLEHRLNRPEVALPGWILQHGLGYQPSLGELIKMGNEKKEFYAMELKLSVAIPPGVMFEKLVYSSSSSSSSSSATPNPLAAWLDSSSKPSEISRFSYMGNVLSSSNDLIAYKLDKKTVYTGQLSEDGLIKLVPFTRLKEDFFTWFSAYSSRYNLGKVYDLAHLIKAWTEAGGRSERKEITLPFVFKGGRVGYFSYKMSKESLFLADSCDFANKEDGLDVLLILMDRILVLDNSRPNSVWLVAMESPNNQAKVMEWASKVIQELESLGSSPLPRSTVASLLPETTIISAVVDESTYKDRISSCKEWIRQGESYQLCLTTKFKGNVEGADPFKLYAKLREKNPAPFSAFIHCAIMDIPTTRAILCSSPERFLKVINGQAEMKPIKGTRKRSPLAALDEALREELRTDEKERAENLMIVDLIRNDLARVCHPHSVKVPRLMQVETYETVHQLVSTVQGILKDQVDVVQVIKATFPPGSMTGAPKLRSVQLLQQLEPEEPRGIYSGILGWISLDAKEADFAVVIRTLILAQTKVSVGAGGAITWLSEETAEWEEMVLKAQAVLASFIQK